MFYDSWPSWLVELVGGTLLVLFLGLVAGLATWPAGLLATLASVVYELRIDRNGWSFTDVLQRQLGILVGLTITWSAR